MPDRVEKIVIYYEAHRLPWLPGSVRAHLHVGAKGRLVDSSRRADRAATYVDFVRSTETYVAYFKKQYPDAVISFAQSFENRKEGLRRKALGGGHRR